MKKLLEDEMFDKIMIIMNLKNILLINDYN